ncbi:hypothetical protein V2G26_017081 [Clonostachys chloroleuca]
MTNSPCLQPGPGVNNILKTVVEIGIKRGSLDLVQAWGVIGRSHVSAEPVAQTKCICSRAHVGQQLQVSGVGLLLAGVSGNRLYVLDLSIPQYSLHRGVKPTWWDLHLRDE